MTQELPSRREWLRRVTVTAAVIGGASGSAVAGDGPETTTDGGVDPACAASDPADVRLVPACTDDDAAVFCVTNEGTRPVSLEWRPVDPPEERIEFVDCRTVRVVGEFADVIVGATFVAADGQIGNLFEPFGGVDGVRTFDVRELEGVPDDAIIDGIEAFRDDPVVPGAGDLAATNPEFDACQEEFFGEVLVESGSDSEEASDEDSEVEADADRGEDISPDDLETLTVGPGETTCIAVEAPDGSVAVQLLRDGEVLVERTSAADVACPRPISAGEVRSVVAPPDEFVDDRS
ncbi:hypothetical protein [Natronococcus sp.]|uniref:hypothetical protein n=1 Tax=Natronococcus sp. TaxID=35747 RepID=UPI0025FB657D|nr:hypothetical protein [Natronococcus sp.]